MLKMFQQVAADAALDLPPPQRDAGLLRMCHVLAELCNFAYIGKASDVGTSTRVQVPLLGLSAERMAVTARLIHFRCAKGFSLCRKKPRHMAFAMISAAALWCSGGWPESSHGSANQQWHACREAAMGHELDCPQQFGIWEVAGLGLVVAFR